LGDTDRCGELDSAGSEQGAVASLCEHGNEFSGSKNILHLRVSKLWFTLV